MAKVTAKFICVRKSDSWQGAYHSSPAGKAASEVTLAAVSDDANKGWSQWTPYGEIKMTINNPAAFDAFELGKHYFVSFDLAPAAEKDEKPAA